MTPQVPNHSLSLSMMISEAAYQVVSGVERLADFLSKVLRSNK